MYIIITPKKCCSSNYLVQIKKGQCVSVMKEDSEDWGHNQMELIEKKNLIIVEDCNPTTDEVMYPRERRN